MVFSIGLTVFFYEWIFCFFAGNSFSSNFKSLHNVMCKYPGLLKYSSSVDHYQPWPFEAYVKIAKVWLEDIKSKVRQIIPFHSQLFTNVLLIHSYVLSLFTKWFHMFFIWFTFIVVDGVLSSLNTFVTVW